VVIADSVVAGLYGQKVIAVLKSAGLAAHLIEFPNGEANKTLAAYSQIFDKLFAIRPAVDRDTIIVALGGGVSGDLAGFVAATALRGLRWVQVPTTLLADVDASVGGKTGVDTAAGKNLVGAFHQPSGVFIDVSALKTLGDDDIRTGLAECVKHGAIRRVSLLEFLESQANRTAIFARDAGVLADLVGQNVAIKAEVVSDDETEAGVRAHLNLGHTVGHAVETLLGYGKVSHGQAISLGMVAACQLSLGRKLIEPSYAARLERLLDQLGLPIRRASLDGGEILRIMQHDKKNRDGKIRMVLPTGPGQVDVFSDISAESIQAAVRYLMNG
jgi:3-dehydroquinate synthase